MTDLNQLPTADDMLQIHCESRSADLFKAFNAFNELDAAGRKALLAAIRVDDDRPILLDMHRYRVELAGALGAKS